MLPATFDEYWNRRVWKFPVSIGSEKESVHGRALATHVLSAPLTLASQLLPPLLKEETPRENSQEHLKLRWCCVGARAEASLPTEYWKELLVALRWGVGSPRQAEEGTRNSGSASKVVDIELDFVGPDLALGKGGRPPETLTLFPENESTSNKQWYLTFTLNWRYRGKFHEYVTDRRRQVQLQDSGVTEYDAYVLLNPGLGHPNLREDWIPTLDLLFGSSSSSSSDERERPVLVLLTAHSKLDADRDLEFLSRQGYISTGLSLNYEDNPFASRISYEDPFFGSDGSGSAESADDKTDDDGREQQRRPKQRHHLVRPNHYAALLKL